MANNIKGELMKRKSFKLAIWHAVGVALFAFFLNAKLLESQKVVQIQSPPIEKQQTPVWCWAASIQNALAAYGVEADQADIVTATYGGVVNLPLFDSRQAVNNLLKNNYLIAPQGRVIHPFFVAGAPSPNDLVRELSRERSPLLVFYMNPGGGGHVVICYGAKYIGSEFYPTITEVLIKDPWEATEKVWPGAQLASLWQTTIFLRVAPRPPSSFFYNGVTYIVSPTFEAVNRQNRMIEGRIWFFNEDHRWHAFNNEGVDLGPI